MNIIQLLCRSLSARVDGRKTSLVILSDGTFVVLAKDVTLYEGKGESEAVAAFAENEGEAWI
jgi:hypothetical protein